MITLTLVRFKKNGTSAETRDENICPHCFVPLRIEDASLGVPSKLKDRMFPQDVFLFRALEHY